MKVGAILSYDARAASNVLLRKGGRQALVEALAFGFGVALAAWASAGKLLGVRELRLALDSEQRASVIGLLSELGLIPVVLVAMFFGLRSAKAFLHSPAVDLLRNSPLAPRSIAGFGVLRASGRAFGCGLAWLVPWTVTCAIGIDARTGSTLLALGSSVVVVLLLALCACSLLQVAVLATHRFLAGSKARAFLTWIGVLGGFGLAVLALLGLVGDARSVARWIAEQQGASLSLGPLAAGITLPLAEASAAGSKALASAGQSWFACGLSFAALALATWLGVVAGAAILDRAHENASTASLTAVAWRRGSWPSTPGASIFAREFVEIRQHPVSLVAWIILAAAAIFLTRDARPDAWRIDPAPDFACHGLAIAQTFLLTALFGITMFVAGATQEDPKAYDLIASSPASRSSLVRGRSATLLVLLLWCGLASILGAVVRSSADTGAISFAIVVIAAQAVVLAVSAVAATSIGSLLQSKDLGGVVAVCLAALMSSPLFFGGYRLFDVLRDAYRGDGPLVSLGHPGRVAAWLTIHTILAVLWVLIADRIAVFAFSRQLRARN